MTAPDTAISPPVVRLFGNRGYIAVGVLVVVVVIVVIVVTRNPSLVRFWPMTGAEFVQTITPLFLVATFIERALEVVVAGLFSGDEEKLKARVSKGEIQETVLLEYKAKTRKFAFSMAVVMGTVIAAIGVRGLEIFVDPAVFGKLTSLQLTVFRTVDVLLTGCLLAGGSDGMHKLVSVFTNGLDKMNKGLKESSAST